MADQPPDPQHLRRAPDGKLWYDPEGCLVAGSTDIATIVRAALGAKAASQPCRCFRKGETGEDYVARIGQQQQCRQRGGACEDAVQRVVVALAEAGVV